jgi:hypothetical protein
MDDYLAKTCFFQPEHCVVPRDSISGWTRETRCIVSKLNFPAGNSLKYHLKIGRVSWNNFALGWACAKQIISSRLRLRMIRGNILRPGRA